MAWTLVISLNTMAFGQEPATVAGFRPSRPAVRRPEAPIQSSPFLRDVPNPHRFWDGKNRLLFSAVAALSAADFGVTHMNLANGGRELNPMVQPFAGNTATLAMNFVGETASVVVVSYLFHRSGHHRLERITPLADIATSAFAVGYGLSHR
jgi:hypothetical protein